MAQIIKTKEGGYRMEYKPIYSSPMLVKHMQEKGIKFEITSPKDAIYILDNVNYYYKLAAYRVNFPKDIDGKYINLDFAYLSDLASIDMQLREYLLSLSMDIEHGIKVRLLHQISSDPNEDGYTIINKFKNKNKRDFDRTINDFKHNRYETDMFNKRHDALPIWVFMEIITFGTLSKFVDFYYEKTQYKRLRPIYNHLRYSKHIRNACAHSNPLLLNLFTDREFLPRPTDPIKQAAKMMTIPIDYLHDLKVNDLTSTFYLHSKIASNKMNEHRIKQGQHLIDRFHRHSDWYADNAKLNTFFSILEKMIDYLNSK